MADSYSATINIIKQIIKNPGDKEVMSQKNKMYIKIYQIPNYNIP